jgi:hypothetical protein
MASRLASALIDPLIGRAAGLESITDDSGALWQSDEAHGETENARGHEPTSIQRPPVTTSAMPIKIKPGFRPSSVHEPVLRDARGVVRPEQVLLVLRLGGVAHALDDDVEGPSIST